WAFVVSVQTQLTSPEPEVLTGWVTTGTTWTGVLCSGLGLAPHQPLLSSPPPSMCLSWPQPLLPSWKPVFCCEPAALSPTAYGLSTPPPSGFELDLPIVPPGRLPLWLAWPPRPPPPPS